MNHLFEDFIEGAKYYLAPFDFSALPPKAKRAQKSSLKDLCFTTLYKEHGVPYTSVTSDSDGVLQFPEGWAGSLSHSEQFLWGVMAPKAGLLGVGLDVETLTRTLNNPQAFRKRILQDSEWLVLQSLTELSETEKLILAFSVKESVYKAQFPFKRKVHAFSHFHIQSVDYNKHIFLVTLECHTIFVAFRVYEGSVFTLAKW